MILTHTAVLDYVKIQRLKRLKWVHNWGYLHY